MKNHWSKRRARGVAMVEAGILAPIFAMMMMLNVYLGGAYEFMGVAVRGKEIEQRRPEMVALTAALADSLKALRAMSGEQLTAALPKEMTTGLDLKEFGDILEHRRDALYPETVKIDVDAGKRVAQSLVAGGLIKSGANIAGLYDTSIAGG